MEYLNLFIKSIFVDNMIFAFFLGMCSFLAVSKNVKTAAGLGLAVIFVLGITLPLNYLLYEYILKPGALAWLNPNYASIDLSFLSYIVFIATIATFTQIVDSKLENGWGYANESIGDTDVFFVSNGIFNDADGNAQAIDSLLFIYKDSVPTIVGQVNSTSTSCPVSLKDGVIYTGGKDDVAKYTVLNNELVRTEAAWVEYDSNGKETYYYQSGDGAETKQADSTEYDRLFEEFAEATPVYFSVVVK